MLLGQCNNALETKLQNRIKFREIECIGSVLKIIDAIKEET